MLRAAATAAAAAAVAAHGKRGHVQHLHRPQGNGEAWTAVAEAPGKGGR